MYIFLVNIQKLVHKIKNTYELLKQRGTHKEHIN